MAGVHTPDSVALPADTFREVGAAAVMDALVDHLGLPLAVKPAKGGSALGFSVVRTRDELRRRWSRASRTARSPWSSGSSRASRSRCR